MAIVVSIQPIDAALSAKGRMATRSRMTPKTMATPIDSRIARGIAMPWSRKTMVSTAPSISVSPWAKFTALADDHMMWKPMATSA